MHASLVARPRANSVTYPRPARLKQVTASARWYQTAGIPRRHRLSALKRSGLFNTVPDSACSSALVIQAVEIMLQTLSTPPSDRFFEDYTQGATYACGSFSVTEDEIIHFATLYDPQAMHTDPASAATGPFGEVIASGWHTIARTMRLLVDNFLPQNGLVAPGVDELRWMRPVRPGDTLTLFVTVEQARRSRTKPDRGLIHTLLEVKNQDGDLVMSMKPMNFIRVRNPA